MRAIKKRKNLDGNSVITINDKLSRNDDNNNENKKLITKTIKNNNNNNNNENINSTKKNVTKKIKLKVVKAINKVKQRFILSNISNNIENENNNENNNDNSVDDDEDDDIINNNNNENENNNVSVKNIDMKIVHQSMSDATYNYDSKGYMMFSLGLKLNDRYIVLKQLGKGTFSRVFAVKDTKLNEKRAIKIIRNVHKYQIAARNELRILLYLRDNDRYNNKNIIHIIDSGYYKMHPMFIFPLYGRSLYKFLYDNSFKGFNKIQTKDILKQILIAVEYVHKLNIVITDLKPENILIVNDNYKIINKNYNYLLNTNIKLIDFGSAVILNNNKKYKHLIQTRHYRSPEVMFNFEWEYSADIWSVACIIIELIYGKMLYNTHDTIDHLNQIITCLNKDIPLNMKSKCDPITYNELFNINGKLKLNIAKRSHIQCNKLKSYFNMNNDSNDYLYDLTTKLMVWDPKERLTAKEALNHPYFHS